MISQMTIFDDKKEDVLEVGGDDYSFLRQSVNVPLNTSAKTINVVDLFSGCGGISLGILEACRSLGYGFNVSYAIDFDKNAYECFKQNFKTDSAVHGDITEIFSSNLGSGPNVKEQELIQRIPSVDVLVGGPPCQGHSDLNNSTRRDDPKNLLYLYMARAAELFNPEHVVVENVVGAIHDKNQVVQTVSEYLSSLGYYVSVGVVNLAKIGVPQTRKRLVLVASKNKHIKVEEIERKYSQKERSVEWAIGDLVGINSDRIIDTPSKPSKDNQRRINFLFENNLFDLPNEERPPCHRNKKHSYKSIYGRLSWNDPSQTITSGFYSMCMGRYVHPKEKRTLTAHEAARLQFFPDYFDFSTVKTRTALATIIGNAVPMKLSYVIGIELLKRRGNK